MESTRPSGRLAPLSEFERLVDQQLANGSTRAEAVSHVARTHPEAHHSYLRRYQLERGGR